MKQKLMYRYGRKVNTHDLVKVLATITMVTDHVGLYFLDDEEWFRIVGRMAAPLFFLLIGFSGMYHQKAELWVYAVALLVAQYYLVGYAPLLNILFNFIIIKFVMQRVDFAALSDWGLIVAAIGFSVANVFLMDVLEYGTLGLGFAIGAMLVRRGHGFAPWWLLIFTGSYGLVCLDIYDASLMHQFAVVIVFVFLFVVGYGYSFSPLGSKNRVLLAISRYSLPIYVFHLTGFRVVANLV